MVNAKGDGYGCYEREIIEYLAVARDTILASSCNRHLLLNGKESILF